MGLKFSVYNVCVLFFLNAYVFYFVVFKLRGLQFMEDPHTYCQRQSKDERWLPTLFNCTVDSCNCVNEKSIGMCRGINVSLSSSLRSIQLEVVYL